MPAVFTSYRCEAEDAAPSAPVLTLVRGLEEALHGRIVPDPVRTVVFRDRSSIPVGEQWTTRLRSSAARALAMVCLVDNGYPDRRWCVEELRTFLRRRRQWSPARLVLVDCDGLGRLAEVVPEVAEIQARSAPGLFEEPGSRASILAKQVAADVEGVMEHYWAVRLAESMLPSDQVAFAELHLVLIGGRIGEPRATPLDLSVRVLSDLRVGEVPAEVVQAAWKRLGRSTALDPVLLRNALYRA